MKSYNDNKFNFFKNNQTTIPSGTTSSYEAWALAEFLSKSEKADLPDDWRLYFNAKGLSNAFNRSLSDMWYEYLGGLGYTGSLRRRLNSYYENGGSL